MRALGLDLGAARIGVALSDSAQTLASPHGAIVRSPVRVGPAGSVRSVGSIRSVGSAQDSLAVAAAGPMSADHAAIAELVASTRAGVVVVGLPLSMDGRVGPAARAVLAEVEVLRAQLCVPVEVADERLSTVSASRAMSSAGRSTRRQRSVIDSAAAAVILQAWLDRRRIAERTA